MSKRGRYKDSSHSQSYLYKQQIQMMARLNQWFVFSEITEYVSPKGYKMTIFTPKALTKEKEDAA